MQKTLLVTNDFPPRPGGIQSYLQRFLQELPSTDIGVYCSTWRPGLCREYDAQQEFPIYRNPTSVLLPTPRVCREVAQLIREHKYETVWFGAAAPLALMSHYLRKHTDVKNIVASTHGHEVGWAMLPIAHASLRIIGNGCDTITYVSEYTKGRIQKALGPHPQMVQLPSGVDTQRFTPSAAIAPTIRQRHQIPDDAPLIACISRLVPRKGQDTLIAVMPEVLKVHPTAKLLIVGGGPYARHLHHLAERKNITDSVIFTGLVPYEELPPYYAAADIFAMPCRTRGKGLDVEGLGIVFLEASASGVPVIVGDSGGAPETVQDGITGVVTAGHDPATVKDALIGLLDDPQAATIMGQRGRKWVCDEWRWSVLGQQLTQILNQ